MVNRITPDSGGCQAPAYFSGEIIFVDSGDICQKLELEFQVVNAF
jgi:hypothetical protein